MKLLKESKSRNIKALEGRFDKSWLSSSCGLADGSDAISYWATALETTDSGDIYYEYGITFYMQGNPRFASFLGKKKKAETLGISEEELCRILHNAENHSCRDSKSLAILDTLISEYPEILEESCYYLGKITIIKTVHRETPKIVVEKENFSDIKFISLAEIEGFMGGHLNDPLIIILTAPFYWCYCDLKNLKIMIPHVNI